MLHDEKKHFPTPNINGNNLAAVTSNGIATSKVSPMWTMDDIDSLRKGIVSPPMHDFQFKCHNNSCYLISY